MTLQRGTFGFMIAADQYLKNKTDDYFDLDPQEAEFQKKLSQGWNL